MPEILGVKHIFGGVPSTLNIGTVPLFWSAVPILCACKRGSTITSLFRKTATYSSGMLLDVGHVRDNFGWIKMLDAK